MPLILIPPGYKAAKSPQSSVPTCLLVAWSPLLCSALYQLSSSVGYRDVTSPSFGSLRPLVWTLQRRKVKMAASVKRFFARSSFLLSSDRKFDRGKVLALNETFPTQFTDWKSVQPFSRYSRKTCRFLLKIVILAYCDRVSSPIVSKLTPNMEDE